MTHSQEELNAALLHLQQEYATNGQEVALLRTIANSLATAIHERYQERLPYVIRLVAPIECVSNPPSYPLLLPLMIALGRIVPTCLSKPKRLGTHVGAGGEGLVTLHIDARNAPLGLGAAKDAASLYAPYNPIASYGNDIDPENSLSIGAPGHLNPNGTPRPDAEPHPVACAYALGGAPAPFDQEPFKGSVGELRIVPLP